MERDDPGFYPRGAIRRMKLTDFMSFVGTVVIEAGARVNVVEGPNGCGKSTLVTALCVGLGGHMKALGRQTRPEELIRRTCSAFELEITVSGGPGAPDIVVHRRTERSAGGGRAPKRPRGGPGGHAEDVDDEDGDDDNGDRNGTVGRSAHTEWRIDGSAVAEARVKELARSLGVHFANLCIFLPQERVAEFSNLSPVQLLESTEESIGKGELLAQHKELIQKSEALKAKCEELQRSTDRLAKVEADQEANRADYERLQRKNRLKADVELLRQKVLWVERVTCEEKLKAAKAREMAEQRKVDAARRRLAETEAPVNARKRTIQATKQAAARAANAAQQLDSTATDQLTELQRVEERCRTTEDKLTGLRERSARWEADQQKFTQQLNQLRWEHQTLPMDLPPNKYARLEEIARAQAQAEAQVGSLDWELTQKREDITRMENQLRALDDTARSRMDRLRQRLTKLERKMPGSRELYEWIQQTKAQGGFRHRVFGPILMEITAIADPTWASYVEQALGKKNLAAVVVENRDDNNLVQDWMKQQRNERARRGQDPNKFFNNQIFLEEWQAPITYPAGEPAAYTQRYGITTTLDRVFETSDDLIKIALANVCSTNVTYIGSIDTERKGVIEALIAETPIRRVYTPRSYTGVRPSIYNPNHRPQKIDEVRPAYLLADDVAAGDEAAERQQMEALQRDLQQANAEVQELIPRKQASEAYERTLEAERKQILEEKRRLEQRLHESSRRQKDLERQLERLRREGNPAAEAEGLREALVRLSDELITKAKALKNLVENQRKCHWQLAAAKLAEAAAEASLAPLQQVVRSAQEAVRSAEAVMLAARQAVARFQTSHDEADARVKEVLGQRGPSAQLPAAWARWPDDLAGLDELLAAKQAEMEQAQAALRGEEAAMIEAWQRREHEIAELRRRKATEGREVDDLGRDLETKKNAWLPALRRQLAEINERVKSHFASIGCAGEVVLREAGEAFENYAAEMRVQHRPNEPMRPLNRNHHSGGERSVATMLYLMALQGVTTTPFRVVDEINQGMDSRNERRVFNLLVESSSRPDTPQCFLLTPKLISNLHYNEHVRVQSLKCIAVGAVDMDPRRVAHLRAEADGNGAAAGGSEGGAGGGGARDHHRRQQPQQQPRSRAVQGLALGQIPWCHVKDVLFFGRSGGEGRG